NLIFRTLPNKNPDFKKRPDPANTVALGEYLSPGCKVCHSPMDGGDFVEGKLFSGGTEFSGSKGGTIRSGNISPDKETGIGNLTKEQFIQKFRFYGKPETQNIPVKDGEFNTIMPWTFLATASDEDLGAVYDYLMTQKPVSNRVEKFTPGPIIPKR
ncbi:MAG: cytochrome C, partial [Ignavibacteria bacterium]